MEGEGGDGKLDGMQNLAVNDEEAKVTEEEKKEEKKVEKVEETEVEKGIGNVGVIPVDSQPKKASVIFFCCKMNFWWKSCITQTNISCQDYLQ